MLKIRRSRDRLISNMGILIPLYWDWAQVVIPQPLLTPLFYCGYWSLAMGASLTVTVNLRAASQSMLWSNLIFHENNYHKTDPITMKFCTYQDSTAVLVCAKFHCDRIDVRGCITKYILKLDRNCMSWMGDRYCMMSGSCLEHPSFDGLVSLLIFWLYWNFNWNTSSILSKLQWNDCQDILHMSHQLCCWDLWETV